MRTAPAFWGRKPGLAADLLLPASWAWDAVGRLRRALARPDHTPVPVICVGNLTAGGAGKTPVAMALAAWLGSRGRAVHVVTRGYGGRLAGPMRVDFARHDAAAVGDEALLHAARAPCWIARDRAAGIAAAATAGAEAILLDDGFQNPRVAKTLALVVIDASYGFGNGRVIPAGPLRENLRRGLARADGVMLLTAEGDPAPRLASGLAADRPTVPAVLAPIAGQRLVGQRLLAFAGIGRPEKFFATLRRLGVELVGQHQFPDHHPFAAAEIAELRRAADRQHASLVTTAKDLMRVPVAERNGIEVLEIEIRWPDPAALAGLLSPIFARSAADGHDPDKNRR
ncbi:MAG TPA: tetraacyldisaccharide 4'-kinase [Stellaceae bacterium]